VFSRFINMDLIIPTVTWVNEYKLVDISLGSLVMLSVISLFRENLVHVRDNYIHTISMICLYNIAEHSFNLHDIASLQLLKLTKAIFNKYCKVEDETEKAETLQVFNSMLEIITKIMRATVSNNPSFIYIVMHHARLFERMAEDPAICQANVELFLELIEYL
jgi:hypothetical protein